MRQIGSIENENHAIRFSDYLLAAGVPNMVEEGAGGGNWSVWIENDDHLDRGRAELDAFRRNPTDPRYDKAGKAAEAVRQAEAKKQRKMSERFVDVRTRWGQPKQWGTPLTLTLIVLSVFVTIATWFGGHRHKVSSWLMFHSYTPARLDALELRDAVRSETRRPDAGDQTPLVAGFVAAPRAPIDIRANLAQRFEAGVWGLGDIARGQVWRLVTPIFIHMSFLHLLFNLFWLRDLGGMIETRRGTWTLAGLVLAGAAIPALAQNFWDGPYFGGMSGVVYALFGYVWMKGRYQPHLNMGVNQNTVTIMLIWLVVCMTGLVGPVANAAHVFGLIVGLVWGFFPAGWRQLRRRATA